MDSNSDSPDDDQASADAGASTVNATDANETDNCEVCLVAQREPRLTLGPCGHQRFCKACIRHLERIGSGCPICRADINMILQCNEADAMRRAMVTERLLVQRDVVRTLVAALMTSCIFSVVEALKSTYNCGVDEFYDDVIEECRSCSLLCDVVYQTSQECADKCPGVASSKQTTMTTSPPTRSLTLSSHHQKDVPQTGMLVMTAVFSFLIMLTVFVVVILLLLRQLRCCHDDDDLFTETETLKITVDHPQHNHDPDATRGLLTPSPVKGIPHEIMPSQH